MGGVNPSHDVELERTARLMLSECLWLRRWHLRGGGGGGGGRTSRVVAGLMQRPVRSPCAPPRSDCGHIAYWAASREGGSWRGWDIECGQRARV